MKDQRSTHLVGCHEVVVGCKVSRDELKDLLLGIQLGIRLAAEAFKRDPLAGLDARRRSHELDNGMVGVGCS
jgi:hypothetical protein